jgi:hypothetical protein
MSTLNSGPDARRDADRHPYDYHYREGMPLRPPPESAAVSPLWLSEPHIEQFSPGSRCGPFPSRHR